MAQRRRQDYDPGIKGTGRVMRKLMAVILGLALAGPAFGQVSAATDGPLPTTIAAAFREAMRSSPVPQGLAEAHRYWTEDGSQADDLDYLGRLQARIRQNRIAQAARPTPLSLTETCVAVLLQGCSVAGAGMLPLDRERRLWWQVQEGHTDEDGVGGGLLVFEQTGDGPLIPVVWTFEAGLYEAPILTRVDSGPLLVAPGVSRGNGAGDASVVMIRHEGGWRAVDTDWQGRAGPLLNGREVRHRPYWYWQEMMAMTPLWRPGDAACCGRAGVAMLSFDVVDERLTLTELRMLAPRDD